MSLMIGGRTQSKQIGHMRVPFLKILFVANIFIYNVSCLLDVWIDHKILFYSTLLSNHYYLLAVKTILPGFLFYFLFYVIMIVIWYIYIYIYIYIYYKKYRFTLYFLKLLQEILKFEFVNIFWYLNFFKWFLEPLLFFFLIFFYIIL